jgi:hypothetical protein
VENEGTKRSDSSELNTKRSSESLEGNLEQPIRKISGSDKKKPSGGFSSRLKNQVSLEVEIDNKNFQTISEDPELASGCMSPTKGAPKFFKKILEEGTESPISKNRATNL